MTTGRREAECCPFNNYVHRIPPFCQPHQKLRAIGAVRDSGAMGNFRGASLVAMAAILVGIRIFRISTNHGTSPFEYFIDHWLLGVEFDVHEHGSVVISGASSGIGRATCGYLAKNHGQMNFYCGIRNEQAAQGWPFNLPNVHPILLDVTNKGELVEAIDSVPKPLVGLINNAGVAELSTVEFQTMESIEQQYQVNVFGALQLTQIALPFLRESKGRILFVSSASVSLPGQGRWGVYQSSKAALEKVAEALRQELSPLSVSISIVAPGFLSTALTHREIEQAMGEGVYTISQQERATYPHIYREDAMARQADFIQHGGSMEETCQAMEHALFAPVPKTRYMSSNISIFPAWLLPKLNSLFPTDRLLDAFTNSDSVQALCIRLQGYQRIVGDNGILGIFHG